jgi:hypothetical protein
VGNLVVKRIPNIDRLDNISTNPNYITTIRERNPIGGKKNVRIHGCYNCIEDRVYTFVQIYVCVWGFGGSTLDGHPGAGACTHMYSHNHKSTVRNEALV